MSTVHLVKLRNKKALVIPLHGHTVRAEHFFSGSVLDTDGHRGALARVMIEALKVVIDTLAAPIGLTEHRKEV